VKSSDQQTLAEVGTTSGCLTHEQAFYAAAGQVEPHRPVNAQGALMSDSQPVFAQSVVQLPKTPAAMPPD
jgi:hypothetical protein